MSPNNRERLDALIDKSAWLLVLIGAAVMAATDWRMLLVLVQWSAFALVLAGGTVVISRVVFPQISLTELLDKAKAGDPPAAIVVAALLLAWAQMFMAVSGWAK